MASAWLLNAELVAFGVRHHDPAPRTGIATVVDNHGAEAEEAGDLSFLARRVLRQ